MLLFNPSPGQIADRYSILVLKKYKAQTAGQSTVAIEAELQKCYGELMGLEWPAGVSELFFELAARNGKQWKHEDAVRAAIKALPEKPSYEELLNIVNIQKLNSEGNEDRARIVGEIDELFRVEKEFKAYA